MSFLRIENLCKSFGKLNAVDNLDLEVNQREVVALIGPNGAGKTTFFNIVTGLLKPDKGRILFRGEDITGLPPNKIVRKSVGRSFQISNVFKNLSVYKNVRIPVLARESKSFIFFWPVEALNTINKKTVEIIEKMGLKNLENQNADILSYGERRKLELGMAIAVKPMLLLLDEPTAGMNPMETENTMYLIKELSEKFGLTLIITEHDMKVVFSLAQRIVVMHHGKIVCQGAPEEIRENEMVRKIYLGEEDWLF